MGHKKVCLSCREVSNLPADYPQKVGNCSHCRKKLIFLPHRFRPPRKSDNKEWEIVEFLVENGFPFQHIYEDNDSDQNQLSGNLVSYPKSMIEAREFVLRYQSQAKRTNT